MTTEYETRGAWFGALRRLEQGVKEVRQASVPEEETADFCGHLNAAATSLATTKRNLMSEVEEKQEGKEYEIYQSHPRTRTYNFDRIVADVMKADESTMVEALHTLMQRGAVKMTFGWKALEALFMTLHIDMEVRKGNPVESGDMAVPHVGEVKESKPQLGAKKED